MQQTVALIGGGGREHVMGEEIARSAEVEQVLFAPGNAGTEDMEKGLNLVDPETQNPVGVNDFGQIVDVMRGTDGLVVVGPEAPLTKGIADILRAEGIAVCGCSAEGSQLEASKAWAEDFMGEFGIRRPPTRKTYNYESALKDIMKRKPGSYVVKANGLADGKGVEVPSTHKKGKRVLFDMFAGEKYKGAGKDIVLIQERYHGPEVTAFMARTNRGYVLFPDFSQDHKRLKDRDTGKNTGGMGAYTPIPTTILSARQISQIEGMAEQTHQGLLARGIHFDGFIYMGLMLAEETDGDPVMIEYNVRLGDPEAQVVLPPLNRRDPETVYNIVRAVAYDDIENLIVPKTVGGAALTVCLAAKGYPRAPKTGEIIHGLDAKYEGVMVHHGGTKRDEDGTIRTSGGRVLYVTAMGENIDEAAAYAYGAIAIEDERGNYGPGIWFPGMQYRRDIAWQARKAA